MIGYPPHNPHMPPPGMMGYPMGAHGPPHGGPPGMHHGGPPGGNNMMEKKIDNWSFSLNNVLGKGSSGTVYKGKNDKTGNSVAIKCVDQRTLITDYAKELIRSEIDIMKQLDHPNIVKLHGFIRTMNNTYIIAEFCGGGDLRDFMKKMRRMNEKEALRIMSEIVSGVNELAKNGIIHRDLKPANILVQDGVFKLTDFGFAKKVDDFEEQMMVSLVGTPLYMSPQILKRQKYTSKCDVWSMGLILYEMLYGDTPWPAFNVIELVNSIHNKPLRFPPNIKVSENTQNFIRQCLQIEEDDRLSVEDVVSYPLFKINQFKEKEGIPPAPAPSTQQAPPAPSSQAPSSQVPPSQPPSSSSNNAPPTTTNGGVPQQMGIGAPGSKPGNQNVNPMQPQQIGQDGLNIQSPNPANFKQPYEYKGGMPQQQQQQPGLYKKAMPGSPKVGGGRPKEMVQEEQTRRQTAYVKNPNGGVPLQQINPHNLPQQQQQQQQQQKPQSEGVIPPNMMKNPTAPNIANKITTNPTTQPTAPAPPSSQQQQVPSNVNQQQQQQPTKKVNNYMPVAPPAPSGTTTAPSGSDAPSEMVHKRLTQPNTYANVAPPQPLQYPPSTTPSTGGTKTNQYMPTRDQQQTQNVVAPTTTMTQQQQQQQQQTQQQTTTTTSNGIVNLPNYAALVPPQKLQHNVSFGDPSAPQQQQPLKQQQQNPTSNLVGGAGGVPPPSTTTGSAPFIATPFSKTEVPTTGATTAPQTATVTNGNATTNTTTTIGGGAYHNYLPAPQSAPTTAPAFTTGAVDQYQANMMNNYLSKEYEDNQRFIGSQIKLLKYMKYLRRKVEDPHNKNLQEMSPFLLEKTVFVILKYSQLISSKLKVGMLERGENVLFLNEWDSFKASENLKHMVEHIQKEYFDISNSFYNLWKRLQENKKFVEDLKRDKDFSEIFVGEVTDKPSYFQRSIAYVRWFIFEMNHRIKSKVAKQQESMPEGQVTGLFSQEDRKTLEVMDGMIHFLELLTQNLTEFQTFSVFCRDQAFEKLYFENNTPITDVALFQAIRQTIQTTLV